MKQLLSPVLLLFGVVGVSHAQDRWDVAAGKIVRLSPMVFENVPPDIRKAFADQGCSIPQTHTFWGIERPHNIVSGEYSAPVQTDWAALCSRHAHSTIVVLWGGPVQCPSMVEVERRDRSGLQGMGPYGIVFSRLLSTTPVSITALYEMDTGLPAKRSHDAIGDAFLDKAATAHYCHEGRWIEFGTAD